MTKPREKTREELQAEIEDGKKKIRQFENREKMLRQKLSKEKRRTRSHRPLLDYLKIVGGETENLSFGAEGVPLDLETEQDYLRAQSESADNVVLWCWV